MGARELYFDNNAFGDLFPIGAEVRAAALRRDLRAAIRARRVVLVTSGWAIEELGGLAAAQWNVYRRVRHFMFANVTAWFDETRELIAREIAFGRRLRGTERCISRDLLTRMRLATAHSPGLVVQSSELHRSRARTARELHITTRERTLEYLRAIDQDPNPGLQGWAAAHRELTEGWTRELLKNQREREGKAPLAADYPLERVPTALNFTAVSMARIAWYLAKKRRVDEGDDTDAHHYTAACYADAFVSGDSRLGQICDLIPDARARPLTLQQFATTYLGWD